MKTAEEIKFTPGPWELQLANSGPRIVQSANATGPKATVICGGLSNNRANAHLIAAAPEMFAALDGLLKAYSVDEDVKDWAPEWRACYAALAKARGEA